MDEIRATDLKTILHSKRANLYYLEHCRVLVNGGRVEYVTCEFLSCLYGSELKYYTFSPLLIKQNHPILLQHPFLSLPSSSTNYQQLTFTSKNRVFTVPPHK